MPVMGHVNKDHIVPEFQLLERLHRLMITADAEAIHIFLRGLEVVLLRLRRRMFLAAAVHTYEQHRRSWPRYRGRQSGQAMPTAKRRL